METTLSVLFDSSGGKGISPKSWPSVPAALRCGFAGGLGPDNLASELGRLERIVGDRSVWIDMQSRVRSEDGAVLDLAKVRACLEASRAYVQQPAAVGEA
jgi:phosphoribosylanthranilate isomerase